MKVVFKRLKDCVYERVEFLYIVLGVKLKLIERIIRDRC